MSEERPYKAGGGPVPANAEQPESPSRRPISPHWYVLGIYGAIVVGAALLRLDAAGNVRLPFVNGPALPVVCTLRAVFHTDCPTCGLTRSFIATAHGEIGRAFGFHRLGPILFAYVLLQLPLRAYAALRRVPVSRFFEVRYGTRIGGAVAVLLLANWVYNLLTGAAFH